MVKRNYVRANFVRVAVPVRWLSVSVRQRLQLLDPVYAHDAGLGVELLQHAGSAINLSAAAPRSCSRTASPAGGALVIGFTRNPSENCFLVMHHSVEQNGYASLQHRLADFSQATRPISGEPPIWAF